MFWSKDEPSVVLKEADDSHAVELGVWADVIVRGWCSFCRALHVLPDDKRFPL